MTADELIARRNELTAEALPLIGRAGRRASDGRRLERIERDLASVLAALDQAEASTRDYWADLAAQLDRNKNPGGDAALNPSIGG